MTEDQPRLFDDPERLVTREDEATYSAILFLRHSGLPVYRVSGDQARVNGSLLSHKQLKHVARVLGWIGPQEWRCFGHAFHRAISKAVDDYCERSTG